MLLYSEQAREVFDIEAQAILGLKARLDDGFSRAVELILDSSGRVIVCGMGKSGIVGKKIAATLASTGTPSFFMHPGEAYHGDLGMVTPHDIFLALSNSGETQEVIKLIPFLRDNGNFLIALTGCGESTLAQASNCHLNIGVEREACPLQLAPTASTTASLAMGDALAVTLMRARDFKPENFARFHPGGSLGKRLLSRVENEMVTDDLPFISPTAGILDVIATISRGRLGICIVDGSPTGIITDGDIRRALGEFGESIFSIAAATMMTEAPEFVEVGTRMEAALLQMEARGISTLLVKKKGNVVGVLKK